MLVAVVLSLFVGMSLGLLGGGGSILTVPILKYVLGMDAHEAIALSLLVVGTTSAAAILPHARRGNVEWRIGIVFGLAGMAGAFAAGRLAKYVPSVILLIAFGIMMFVTAIAMLRSNGSRARAQFPTSGAASESKGARRELPLLKIIADGLAVGAVTGLVGAGGGFLVVPALVLLGGMPMEVAIGTSLLVITMKSMAGFAGFLGHTPVDWSVGLAISAAAIAGSLAGSMLSGKLSAKALREGFGWLVVAMAFFILAQELPVVLGHRSSPLAAVLIAVGVTLIAFFTKRSKQRRSTKYPRVVRPAGTPHVGQLGEKA